MRRQSKASLRLKMKWIYILPFISIILMGIFLLIFNLSTPKKVTAATETINSGSFIINMGVTPQTINNGLKPYGMVYDLMVNYNVPIKWVIEPTKIKDGADFTYSATAYKGGTFIVPVENITSAITSRITYWTGQGVVGVYTTSAISVPVYATITNWPKLIIDDVSNKQSIIIGYFTNAMVPASGYSTGTPSLLTPCHDMWANPHGDPTWATHGYLYNLVTVTKSFVWMQCHAVSVTEGVKNPSAPFEQLNFLTSKGLKCYSGSNCGSSITETHSGNPTAPFTHFYPTDPIMQFMGTMDGATGSGSEQWYIPQSTGKWNNQTKRLVTTSDGVSPREGTVMAYGPAFGDPTNGYVMYEGGHDLDGSGTTAEKVAAQRAFFNFLLLAGITKQLVFNSQATPASLMGNETGACSVSVSSGSSPYTYAWSSTVGGQFTNSTAASTSYKAPVVSSPTTGNLICTVTDACGRKNFVARPISVSTQVLPIELKSFDANVVNGIVDINWITSSEINNDYFTIERSSNGETFTAIGQVRGNGNSTSDIYYSFNDESPFDGTNYYRLKQTDYDGTSKYYGPVSARINKGVESLSIQNDGANPFTDKINLTFVSGKSSSVTISIVNIKGEIVQSENIPASPGINYLEFRDMDELPAGLYFAVIRRDNESKLIKLLKRK